MPSHQLWMGNLPEDMKEAEAMQFIADQDLPPPFKFVIRSSTGQSTRQYGIASWLVEEEMLQVLNANFFWPNQFYALIRHTALSCFLFWGNGHSGVPAMGDRVVVRSSPRPHMLSPPPAFPILPRIYSSALHRWAVCIFHECGIQNHRNTVSLSFRVVT